MKSFGKAKQRNICRWVSAAKALPQTIIDKIDARVQSKGVNHNVKESYFFDNPYLCPAESKQQYKLSETWMESAVDQLFSQLDGGGCVSVKVFEDSICKTLKLSQAFVTAKEKRYGKLATDSPAWQEVVKDFEENVQTH